MPHIIRDIRMDISGCPLCIYIFVDRNIIIAHEKCVD